MQAVNNNYVKKISVRPKKIWIFLIFFFMKYMCVYLYKNKESKVFFSFEG